jgi:hydrogenase small subunit
MLIGRREFLKYCIGSAAALGLDMSVLGKLEKALAADAGLPKVIWLSGASCTGCTVSLANLVGDDAPKDVADLLINTIDLAFHPNLMGAAGDLAVETLHNTASEGFILVVEGGIPTAFNGHTCMLWSENGHEVTAKEAILSLAPKAAAVLCVGTCAGFGGLPAGDPNPTQILDVGTLTGLNTINIPGCPVHPDWIVGTIARLLAGEMPALDDEGRPEVFFKTSVHKVCPRKGQEKVTTFGLDGGCLKELGCKGPKTGADCPNRMWNNSTNWCIGANAVCIGCTEKGFPDKFSPFYKVEYGYQEYAGADTVAITGVVYNPANKALRVTATSSAQPDAALTAEGFGKLRWKSSKNFYRRTFTDIKAAPASLIVTSSGGGTDTYITPGNSPDTNTAMRIKKAEWKAKKSELRVEGEGIAGAIVTVSDADSKTLLGAVSVDSRGKWKFKLKKPSSVPGRVQAASDGAVAVNQVKNAPAYALTN